MPAWLLIGYLLLVPSFSQTKDCTGEERNAIRDVLNDVNWKVLADQLNLQDKVADIQDICHREIHIRPCYFREVLSRYIQSQPEESCDNTRRKIVTALEELRYVNEASQLRRLIVEDQISSESSALEPIKHAIFIFVAVSIAVYTYKPSPIQQEQPNKRQDQASQKKEIETGVTQLPIVAPAITATTSLVIAVFAVVFGPLVAAIVAVAIHTAMHTDITKKCNVN